MIAKLLKFVFLPQEISFVDIWIDFEWKKQIKTKDKCFIWKKMVVGVALYKKNVYQKYICAHLDELRCV